MSDTRPAVLVTGGARGIGKAICRHYEEQGWIVLAPARNELDVGDAASIRGFFEHLDRPLTAVVNNAGINPIHPIEETGDEDLEATVAVNALGPFRILREAFPLLNKGPGTKYVVNISSIWAGVSKPGRGAYSLTKTALIGLTRTAALEWAPRGILVNALAPGYTLTELTMRNNSPEAIKAIEHQIPLGRLARPEDIASSVFFLGSPLNTYITGQTLFVDGGYTCQ